MRRVMPLRTIEILRDDTHGRRIVCSCGFEDKAYTKDSRGCAAVHNNTKHAGKYEVRSVGDLPLKTG